jgi:RNA polymerase sigma-70 factor (ECF subfamily)
MLDNECKMPRLVSDTAMKLTLSQIVWMGAEIETTPSLESEILTLFDSLRLPLLRYSISFGISVTDGEDIVQETFLALFDHLRKGRSRANLRGWLFRVIHNLALKRRKRYKNQLALINGDSYEPETYLSEEFNPEQIALLGERQAQLLTIYKALSEDDRRCLQLRSEGLTYREIAHVLGISLGTVSNSLGRSLSRLMRPSQR